MKANVTVLKSEFVGKEAVNARLSGLSFSVNELANSIKYTTLEGSLIDFLSVLKEHRISYHNHFDMADASAEKDDAITI
jgi:hypothetical protein